MKLIAQLKLQPSKEQAKFLRQTLEKANAACDAISEICWKNKTFGQYAIHKIAYKSIRKQFGLSSQVVVRCIAKVASAYKIDKEKKRTFKPFGAIAYDDRILRFFPDKQFVTIWTIAGRQTIPYLCGERQKQLLKSRQGESDLVLHRGQFYLLPICEVPEPTTKEVDDAIGADLGIVNILTDSTGESFSGKSIEKVRKRYHKIRRALQKRHTKSAKRHLKKLSKKESRFRKNENHCISKKLVLKAKARNSLIGLEDLKGIRGQTTVRRKDRAKHSGWAFAQLKGYVEYKSRLHGVPAIEVDPRNSSKECSACNHIARANRRSQSEFCCVNCGHAENADLNASKNIAQRAMTIYRAAVNRPIAVRPRLLPTRATGTASLAL